MNGEQDNNADVSKAKRRSDIERIERELQAGQFDALYDMADEIDKMQGLSGHTIIASAIRQFADGHENMSGEERDIITPMRIKDFNGLKMMDIEKAIFETFKNLGVNAILEDEAEENQVKLEQARTTWVCTGCPDSKPCVIEVGSDDVTPRACVLDRTDIGWVRVEICPGCNETMSLRPPEVEGQERLWTCDPCGVWFPENHRELAE